MLKLKLLAAFCCCCVMATFGAFHSVSAEAVIYGTMDIPYADFYRAELTDSTNAYDVDAVSSATTAKWSKNEEGGRVEGTFNSANADETGTILGVTYPVAITKATLDALGSENFNFTELTDTPAAYKEVTYDGNTVSFSAVVGNTNIVETNEYVFKTDTSWGDYLIDVSGTPEDMGAIYGLILKTKNGEAYAMRHLENIWGTEIAWSTGFVKEESHGNTLSYENFVGIMGETVNRIRYITKNGYYDIDISQYIPLKFNGSVAVADAAINAGTTSITMEGFPSEYSKSFAVEGLNSSVSDSNLTYSNALPGVYTITVSDLSKVYCDMTANFTLTSDKIPAKYENQKILQANDATNEEFANYMKNISAVTVNETKYNASGRGAVAIIGEDGAIDMAAESKDSAVFDGSDNYAVIVSSDGYPDLSFTLNSMVSSEETNAADKSKDANTKIEAPKEDIPASSGQETTTASSWYIVAIVAVILIVIAGIFFAKSKRREN